MQKSSLFIQQPSLEQQKFIKTKLTELLTKQIIQSPMIRRSSSLMTFHLKDKSSDEKYQVIRRAVEKSELNQNRVNSLFQQNHHQIHNAFNNNNANRENIYPNNLQQIIKNSRLPNDAKFLLRDREQYRVAQKIDKRRFKELYRTQIVHNNIPIDQNLVHQLAKNNSSQKIVYKFGNIHSRNQTLSRTRQNLVCRKTSKVEQTNENKFNFRQKRQNILNMKPKQDKYNLFSAIDEFVNKAIDGKIQFGCGKNELVAANQDELIIDIQ